MGGKWEVQIKRQIFDLKIKSLFDKNFNFLSNCFINIYLGN